MNRWSRFLRGRPLSGAVAAGLILASAAPLPADRPFFRPGRSAAAPPDTGIPVTPAVAPPPLTLPHEVLREGPALPTLPAPGLAPFFEPESLTNEVQRAVSATVIARISESFLNRFIAHNDVTAGGIAECVLGADVRGEQTTSTALRVDLLPSDSTARFEVILQGQTRSRTTSSTRQASVDSTGNQKFDVRKPIDFDGWQFITRSPGAFVESTQKHHQARTRATAVPVIGSIADSIALLEANRRLPIAEQEGARRLTERVAPTLNESIDEQLAKANRALAEARERTGPIGSILQQGLRCRTTDEEVLVELQVGAAPPATAAPRMTSHGAALRIHESAMTAWLSDTGLAGQEIAISDLESWLATVRGRLGFRSGPAGAADPDEAPAFGAPAGATLVLASERPLAVRFDNDEFQIVLRVAIRPIEGAELPGQRIVIAYACTHEGEEVRLRPLPASVSAEAPGGLINDALDTLVRDQIESRLEPVVLPASLSAPGAQGEARLSLAGLSLRDGWLSLDWE
ncbi:MAG: hypothetical protein KF774_16995 [Planctomyces sp.]|nr:hypothetical protein [Planctomyces sp.]